MFVFDYLTVFSQYIQVNEFVYQLEDSGAHIVVAGESVADKALQAMFKVGLPESNLIVLPDLATRPGRPGFGQESFKGISAVSVPTVLAAGAVQPNKHTDQDTGKAMPLLPPLDFSSPDEAKKRIAYIVYSSGTTVS